MNRENWYFTRDEIYPKINIRGIIEKRAADKPKTMYTYIILGILYCCSPHMENIWVGIYLYIICYTKLYTFITLLYILFRVNRK